MVGSDAVAVIDTTPLYKYVVGGPDGRRLVDRVITRDAAKLTQGRVFYTTLGHEPEVYWNPVFLQHLLAGIQFALGDLPGETATIDK